MSDTPETDKALAAVLLGTDRYSFPEHARRMERERDAALARVAELEARLYQTEKQPKGAK